MRFNWFIGATIVVALSAGGMFLRGSSTAPIKEEPILVMAAGISQVDDNKIVTSELWVHINSKVLRSGLVLGVNGARVTGFAIEPLNGQELLEEEYLNPRDWLELGSYRHYVAAPRGLYKITVRTSGWAPLTWRYAFEGEAASDPFVVIRTSK